MLTIVVLCDHGFISGGASRVAIESACGLARKGHRVIYIAAVGPMHERLRADGVEVECLDQHEVLSDPDRLGAAARGIWNRLAARRLADILSRFDPETTVVHVHGWAKALSPSVGRVIGLSGVPSVHTLHDFFLVCPNGGLFDYRQNRHCTLTPMSGACVVTNCDSRSYAHKLWRVARQGTLHTFGRLPNGAGHFIYLSEYQLEVISSLLPGGAHLYHVPNPVLVEDAGPAPVGENDAFVFVGRLSPEKGAVLFARAAKELDVPAVFIGDGFCRAEVLSIYPQAEITGWLPPEEAYRRMRGARALVFPSVCHETFGLTAYEALANGLPVIVSDQGAGREAIMPGETGLLFKQGDVQDLKRRVLLLQDVAVAERMGWMAYRSYWAAPLTLERHARSIECVYKAVLRAPLQRSAAGA